MAALMGKDGFISIGANSIGYIDTWNVTAAIGSAEVTAYGDPIRNYAYGIKEWSGNLSGTLSLSDAQQVTVLAQASTATLATVALRMNATTGGSYWGGNAYIKSATITSKVDDKVSVSVAFQGTGNLAYTST
jgi:hypothetical protein